MRKKKYRSICSITLFLFILTGVCVQKPLYVQATEDKVLTLEMAKKSALSNSPKMEKLESELNVKEVSLKQAIKSIKVKKKNMSTFRWSPLLSFKFPEKPDLAEAYEFEFKPVQIQAQIDTVKHQMTDQMLEVYEEISNLYVEIVVLEDQIAFEEARLDAMHKTLLKNRAKLKLGEATKSDIDAMERSLKALRLLLIKGIKQQN